MAVRMMTLFSLLSLIFISPTEGAVARIYGFKKPPKYLNIPKIRVRVRKGMKNVFISGTDLKRKIHVNNDVKAFEGRKSIRFNCFGLAQRTKKPSLKPVLLASLVSSTGLVSLKKEAINERYKGLLHIVASPMADSCDVVHETDIEDYLSSLLSKEMNAKWPLEALKAQAIAARTYAIYKMESRQVSRQAGFETFYHLESSEKHQVGGHFLDSTKKTQRASLDTRGEVLIGPAKVIKPIFFHAKCGGHTLRPDQVWQSPVRGYKAMNCSFCRNRGNSDYHKGVSLARFKKFLKWVGKKGFSLVDPRPYLKKTIKITPDNRLARTVGVSLGSKVIRFKKALIRRYFGRKTVPSNNFEVKFQKLGEFNQRVSFKGSGFGHGVGMCQLGALDLAARGWDYKRILSYYFPRFKVKRIY